MAVTEIGLKLKKSKEAEFFMPPLILDEFLTFVDESDDYVQDFLAMVIVKAPDFSKIEFPARLFYELVKEMRHRSYRGLQISEELLLETGKSMMVHNKLNRIEYQKTIGEHVKKLRERYRIATRVKFLDSVADLDLIVLAKELNATLITSDEGVLRWGREFGVKEAPPQVWKKTLHNLA